MQPLRLARPVEMPVPIRKVRRFHLARLIAWSAQIPLAILTDLKRSVTYLVFLSVAAVVESALTDYLQARQSEREDPTAEL